MFRLQNKKDQINNILSRGGDSEELTINLLNYAAFTFHGSWLKSFSCSCWIFWLISGVNSPVKAKSCLFLMPCNQLWTGSNFDESFINAHATLVALAISEPGSGNNSIASDYHSVLNTERFYLSSRQPSNKNRQILNHPGPRTNISKFKIFRPRWAKLPIFSSQT